MDASKEQKIEAATHLIEVASRTGNHIEFLNIVNMEHLDADWSMNVIETYQKGPTTTVFTSSRIPDVVIVAWDEGGDEYETEVYGDSEKAVGRIRIDAQMCDIWGKGMLTERILGAKEDRGVFPNGKLHWSILQFSKMRAHILASRYGFGSLSVGELNLVRGAYEDGVEVLESRELDEDEKKHMLHSAEKCRSIDIRAEDGIACKEHEGWVVDMEWMHELAVMLDSCDDCRDGFIQVLESKFDEKPTDENRREMYGELERMGVVTIFEGEYRSQDAETEWQYDTTYIANRFAHTQSEAQKVADLLEMVSML